MEIVCLDLEGTLAPELWIEIAQATGIRELELTTRDEPDFAKLMDLRMSAMREHGLSLPKLQGIIARVEPLPGARDFLDRLRRKTQAIIVSDTFEQFAEPLLPKLGSPTILCGRFDCDGRGMVCGWHMRAPKLDTVRAFQSIGYQTIAAGDSHNDLDMIRASKAGFLIHAPQAIRQANPDIQAVEDYPRLLAAIEAVL